MEIIVRPFALLAMLFLAWWVSTKIKPLIPEGLVKEVLYRPREIYPSDYSTVTPRARLAARIFCGTIALLILLNAIGYPIRLLWS